MEMKAFAPLKDVDSILSILSRISFLGGVNEIQRDKIFDLMEVAEFKKGEFVTRKGEAVSNIFIINKGKIGLLISDDEVTNFKREFGVGECFGEAALLSMTNNTASFVAVEDSEIVVLPRRALNHLRKADPDLFSILILNLARELARKLQFTDEILLKYQHEYGPRV